MKFLIAPDSFKRCATAKQASDAIEIGLKRVFPQAQYTKVPMADGGEGTVQSLTDALNGNFRYIRVFDPLGKKITARYGLIKNKHTAIIEMSAASGMQFVTKETQNPMITSTFGTGQLLKDALHQKNIENIIIGIGGSATIDGGVGMAEALGVKFLDKNNQPIRYGGGGLRNLNHIDVSNLDPLVKQKNIYIASDVDNPLFGENGAAFTFGAQKGANQKMMRSLDNNLRHLHHILKRDLNLDLADKPGSGAAGGLGLGLIAFTNATMEKGINITTSLTELGNKAKDADFVFTGEGRIDEQTLHGKTPIGVSEIAKEYNPNTKVIALVGSMCYNVKPLYEKGIDAIFSISPGRESRAMAIKNIRRNLIRTAENIGHIINN